MNRLPSAATWMGDQSCTIARHHQRSAVTRWARAAGVAAIVGAAISVLAVASLRSAEVPAEVLRAEKQRIAAIAKAAKTAVSVFGRDAQGGGSGVVITADGYALTNYHVARPAGDYMKCSMADGQLYDAVIVGIDPTGDVALIKLLGRDDFPHAEMADSEQVRVGDWCFAVGNPFLLATDFQPTITYGIVSGVHRYQYPAGTLLEYADCIQTDASINPGNSGGPLFNARGQLIGVNGRGSFEKRGRVNVGVGYAISINQIKHFLGHLHSGRIVDHATLGATVSTDDDGRVVVTNILQSSDAYRRGLRYGDEIVSFGGRAITTVNGFKNVLGIFPKGWRVPLSYRQDGVRRDVLVRLAGVHGSDELVEQVQRPPLPMEPQPRKKKGKSPAPDKDDEQPGDKPQLPIPIPQLHPRHEEAMPEHVAKIFTARTGFGNYYFNELHRDRVWDAFCEHSEFANLQGDWQIRGRTEDGAEVSFVLGRQQVMGTFPEGKFVVQLSQDFGDQLEPAGSGGLLVALHLWQRMLTLSPKQFGEVYYLGTAPLAPRHELMDVLVATHQVVESRFYFDPQTGQLVGLEMFPDLNVDPCELYFSEFLEVDGRMLPARLEVRYGDRVYGVFHLQHFELAVAAEKQT